MLIDNESNSCASSTPPSIPITPYKDKKLFSPPHVYADFLQRAHSCNMLCWRRARGPDDGVLGVFFVSKKNRTVRLIFDTRLLNQKFIPPPKTQLPSAAGFSNLEVHDGDELFIASSDVKNALYVLEIPTPLAHMFSLPCIRYK